MQKVSLYSYEGLLKFDGTLAPSDNKVPYVAVISRLDNIGAWAVSFWDNTIDTRPGSNSIFFIPQNKVIVNIKAHQLLTQCKNIFPEIWTRFPEITIHLNSLRFDALTEE